MSISAHISGQPPVPPHTPRNFEANRVDQLDEELGATRGTVEPALVSWAGHRDPRARYPTTTPIGACGAGLSMTAR
jgi:hypothetical protein